MKIKFNKSELDILVHDLIKPHSVDVLYKFIEELKYRQKRFLEIEGEIISGFELLKQAHQDGIIQTLTYLKIYEVLQNPNSPYEVTIK